MAVWGFKAFDVLTGNFLCDVPVISWEGTDPLDAATLGTFNAEVLLDSAKASTWVGDVAVPVVNNGVPVVNDGVQVVNTQTISVTRARRRVIADSLATEPAGRTILVAVRNGQVVQPSGIIWDWSYTADKPGVLSVKGEALLSFFDTAQREHTLTYTDVDQLEIFRDLIERCQFTNTAMELPMTSHGETSGVLRKRTYKRADNRRYIDLLIELSQVRNGFEFDMRCEVTGDNIQNHLRLWYPRRGRSIVDHPDLLPQFRATRGGNATLFSVTSGAGRPWANVDAFGAGDGDDMLIRSAVSSDLIAGGWPGRTTTISHKDVTRAATLQEHADDAVDRMSLVDAGVFDVRFDPDSATTRWGSWDLGDDAVVIIEDEPLFPRQDDMSPGAVKFRRVVQHRVSVSSSGEVFTARLGRTG